MAGRITGEIISTPVINIMIHKRVTYIILAVIILIACSNSSELFTVKPRPTLTPTFVLARYATPTSTPRPTDTPAVEPTEFATETPEEAESTPTAQMPTRTVATDNAADDQETTFQSPVSTPTPEPTATVEVTIPPAEPPTATVTPTETIVPTPAPLAGRIAFPVDDGGGNYDVWVVELPDGEPFLIQARARQPNFSKDDGRLLVKTQANDLGESIGLLDANYTWRGIVNEEPADSYPFWHPDGTRYTYSNSNLVLDPDTAHLAPYIFTACSLELPKFENEIKCQDMRSWGIDVGEAPVWTDDDRLVFFTYKGDDGIYFIESASVLRQAGGLAPKQLLVLSNGFPTDTYGSQVFFSAGDIDGNWEAYAIDLDGSNLTNLSNAPEFQDGLPTVSPDGSWVAFVSDRDGKWGIWVVPRSGGEPTKVVDISKINTNPSPWGTENRAWMTERISWGP